MGYSLSVISLFGLVALAGVVVNDSLVLIYYANTLRDQGKTPIEAIRLAAVRRFRPIVHRHYAGLGALFLCHRRRHQGRPRARPEHCDVAVRTAYRGYSGML